MLYQPARPPFPRRHPVVVGIAAAVAVWWLWLGWYAPLVMIVGAGMIVAVRRRRRAAAVRDAGLRARADFEHRLCLSGDPRGTFGRYPAVQPGWYVSPDNGRLMRYFDGAAWTGYTAAR
ncbi:hypothetical protein ASG82_08095 [Mycobacterium sp. Soil538]|nr:hypothetical protein ASG82_08095 [Mycobacterium sp. Soil538]